MLLTVRVELPDPVTDVGLSEADSAAGALAARATVPEKPPRDVTVMLLLAEDGQAVDVIAIGFAVNVKSWTLTVTIVVWVSSPSVAVTVTV